MAFDSLKQAFYTAKSIGTSNEKRNVLIFRIIIFSIIIGILIYYHIKG